MDQIKSSLAAVTFLGQLGKTVPERSTVLDFNEARDDGVVVASTGPHANHLHIIRENNTSTSLPKFSAALCNEIEWLY